MTADELNELVNSAIRRWCEIRGIPIGGSGKIKVSSIRSWDLQKHAKAIEESRKLDKTGMTTFMLLRGTFEEYLKNESASFLELMEDTAAVIKRLESMNALRAILESPEVIEIVDGVYGKIRATAVDLGMNEDQLKALAEFFQYKEAVAFVRRNALRSMELLKAYQFTQGAPSPERLKLNAGIFEMWNMNSLVAALSRQGLDGVTMVLIRDPDSTFASYVVWAVRNGHTITVLTDRAEGPYPTFQYHTRRPDRDLERRAEQNHFPYQLLELKRSEQGQLYETARTAMVPYNLEAVQVSRLADLCPDEFMWAVLVFDRIREVYGEQNKQLSDLSYTGEMVIAPGLLEAHMDLEIKRSGYKPLKATAISRADVTVKSTAAQWELEPTRWNQWMEDRYAARVEEEFLNVVGDEDRAEKQQRLENNQALVLAGRSPLEYSRADKDLGLEALSPVTFGTRRKLERDRIWTARVNQMRIIRRLAQREFEDTWADVVSWYRAAVKANVDEVMDAVASGAWMLPCYGAPAGFEHGRFSIAPSNCVSQMSGRRFQDCFEWVGAMLRTGILFGHPCDTIYRHIQAKQVADWSSQQDYFKIETRASIFTRIQPTCADAVALVTRTAVGDLPWQLQHWYSGDAPYVSNYLLDRLDPQDWILSNPWTELCLTIGVCLSKTTFKSLLRNGGYAPREVPANAERKRRRRSY